MATKITKSELKEMIKEALREELSKVPRNRRLKEAAVARTSRDIVMNYEKNVAEHIMELEHEKAFSDAE